MQNSFELDVAGTLLCKLNQRDVPMPYMTQGLLCSDESWQKLPPPWNAHLDMLIYGRFPKLGVPFWGSHIRTIVFGDLYWVPLIWETTI